MTTKRWLLCGSLVAGLAALLALRGQSQEMDGFARPDGGPDVEGRELPGPGGQQGFPGPGMMGQGGRPGGFQGGPRGMRGGPMGPGGPMGRIQDPEVRERIEKEMKVRRQVGDLARKYREAGSKEKDSAKAELKKALGELFDAEMSNREHRAQKLQEEASRLKEAVSKGKANKDKLVSRRLEQLADADGLGW